MSKSVAMEYAFVGAILGLRERIDKAIENKETWNYQFGRIPTYIGNLTVVDAEDPDNDSVRVTFCKSPWDVYDYRIRAEFHDMDGVNDVMIFDVNTKEFRFSVFPEYAVTAVPIESASPPVDSEAEFVFYPYDDITAVLAALSGIPVAEMEMTERELERIEEEARKNERLQRRSRFQLIDGSKC